MQFYLKCHYLTKRSPCQLSVEQKCYVKCKPLRDDMEGEVISESKKEKHSFHYLGQRSA